MNKWYLISNEDMETIRVYLQAQADAGDERARAALHTLDSGLNTTDEVPDDWKEETEYEKA